MKQATAEVICNSPHLKRVKLLVLAGLVPMAVQDVMKNAKNLKGTEVHFLEKSKLRRWPPR